MKTLTTIFAIITLAISMTSCTGDYQAYDAGVSYINQKDSLEIEYKKMEIENERLANSIRIENEMMTAKIDSISNVINNLYK